MLVTFPPPTPPPPAHNAAFSILQPPRQPPASRSMPTPTVLGEAARIHTKIDRFTSDPNLFPEKFSGNYSLVCQLLQSLFFVDVRVTRDLRSSHGPVTVQSRSPIVTFLLCAVECVTWRPQAPQLHSLPEAVCALLMPASFGLLVSPLACCARRAPL